MAITKNTGRQWPLVASVSFGFADIPTTATVYEALDLPNGAVVTGAALIVDTAWATATTATLSAGDADLATRYLSAVDLKATAGTVYPVTLATKGSKDVNVTYAFTGTAATAGAATLVVQYVIAGKANEVQPTSDAV